MFYEDFAKWAKDSFGVSGATGTTGDLLKIMQEEVTILHDVNDGISKINQNISAVLSDKDDSSDGGGGSGGDKSGGSTDLRDIMAQYGVSFDTGGVVGAGLPLGTPVPALVHAGELILNPRQQRAFTRVVNHYYHFSGPIEVKADNVRGFFQELSNLIGGA